jgi:Ca2+-binding RTX toxin-like protein
MGGVGADRITLGNTASGGTSIVLGDNGIVQMDPTGTYLASIMTTGFNQDLGGDDTIVVGNGNMVIMGGYGSDTITAGAGNSVILGDNGSVAYNALGLFTQVATTDISDSTGGNNVITAGNGNFIVMGGVGADTISLADTAGGTTVVLGDNGIVQMDPTGTFLASVTTTGFDQNLGGNDSITVGNGTMVIFGGYGADTITAGTATATFSVLVGDNGTATYDASGLLAMVTTTDTSNSTGGDDIIKGGDGNYIAIGGVGNDNITLGNGNAYVLGDNGTVNLDPSITSTGYVEGLGGDDVITVGNGNHAIIGGIGNDIINSGNGSDYLFGDNGMALFNPAGIVGGIAIQAQTLDTVDTTGGADTITTLNGNKTIFGGPGNDSITAGNGTHVVFGDEGAVTWTAAGVLVSVQSLEPALGGNDVIQVGNGDSYLLGGAGADIIVAGNSINHSVIFGDNGFILFDAQGHVATAQSTDPQIGGDDLLISGNGNDILIGGYGNDHLVTGTGNSVLIGDSGLVQLVNNNLAFVETIDLLDGGNDILQGGSGHNIEMGGYGNNLLYGNLTNDILIGNYAAISFNSSGIVTSLQRYGYEGYPGDLIGAAQDWLFNPQPEVAPLYVPTGTYAEGEGNGLAFSDSFGGNVQTGATASDDTSGAFYEGGDEGDFIAAPTAPAPDDAPGGDADAMPQKAKSPVPAAAPVPADAQPASGYFDGGYPWLAPVQAEAPAPIQAMAAPGAASPGAKHNGAAQASQGAARSAAAVAAGVALSGLAAAGRERAAAGSVWTFDRSSGTWRATPLSAPRERRIDLGAGANAAAQGQAAPAAVAPAWFAALADASGGDALTPGPAIAAAAAPASRARIDWTARRTAS